MKEMCKKAIVYGIGLGLLMIVIGMIFYTGIFGGVYAKYSNLPINKPMEPLNIWMLEMILADIVVAIIFAATYFKFSDSISYSGFKKGIFYGSVFWLIMNIPQTMYSYLLYTIPNVYLVIGAIVQLIQFLTMGAVLSFLIKKFGK